MRQKLNLVMRNILTTEMLTTEVTMTPIMDELNTIKRKMMIAGMDGSDSVMLAMEAPTMNPQRKHTWKGD